MSDESFTIWHLQYQETGFSALKGVFRAELTLQDITALWTGGQLGQSHFSAIL